LTSTSVFKLAPKLAFGTTIFYRRAPPKNDLNKEFEKFKSKMELNESKESTEGKRRFKRQPLRYIANISEYWQMDPDHVCLNFEKYLPDSVVYGTDDVDALAFYNAWGNSEHVARDYEAKLRAEIQSYTMSNTVYSNEECARCHKKQVISYDKQMRCADEPSTVFKVCFNCNYTTRH